MLLDHCNKALLIPQLVNNSDLGIKTVSYVLGAFGRFAFPIFFFLLVEGFHNTRNRWNYLGNLILFGLLSEIPYNLFLGGAWFYPEAQNICFTLALALGVIWIIDWAKCVTKHWLIVMLTITMAGFLLAYVGRFDYGGLGVLIPLAFYLFRSKPEVAAAVGYCAAIGQFWSWPSFLLTTFYNGQRGRQCKWLNYWFYPVHLLALGLIRRFGMI